MKIEELCSIASFFGHRVSLLSFSFLSFALLSSYQLPPHLVSSLLLSVLVIFTPPLFTSPHLSVMCSSLWVSSSSSTLFLSFLSSIPPFYYSPSASFSLFFSQPDIFFILQFQWQICQHFSKYTGENRKMP